MEHQSALLASLWDYQQRWSVRSFKDRQGLAWNYRDSMGTGPTVVLLPGALGSGDVAWKLADAISEDCRSIAVTYPSGYSVAELADGLDELLDFLVIDSAYIWASSYAAWWAPAFASKFPSKLRGLWLSNTFIDGEDVKNIPLFNLEWLNKSTSEQVRLTWLDFVESRPASELKELQIYMLLHGLTANQFHKRLQRVATAEAIPPALNVSNLVVCECDDDALMSPTTRARVRSAYPNARHVRMKSGGHYPHVVNIEEILPDFMNWLGLDSPK
jgi:maspardin